MTTFEVPSFLPITEQATKAALQSIALDPYSTVMSEGEIVEIHNPELNFSLHLRVQTMFKNLNPDMYINGALFTHRILRMQAELNKVKLPIISRAIGDIYDQDIMREIEQMGNPTISQLLAYKGNLAMTREPELSKALQEMAKYLPLRNHFYGGAADVYFILKAAQEAEELTHLIGK